MQAGSRLASAAASPARAAGMAAGEGHSRETKIPKDRQGAAVPTQPLGEAKLGMSVLGTEPVGTFSGGRRKEEQHGLMLTGKSLAGKVIPLLEEAWVCLCRGNIP